METFENLNLTSPLQNAIEDLGFTHPTPIQLKAFPVIRSGKNVIGISQTGTGKTLAFTLPLLQDLGFTKQLTPRILILVPTRELVIQIVEQVKNFSKYMNLRIQGIYGGTNINTQKKAVREGVDVIVATPGRLYDIVIDGSLKLKTIKKVVIDEVDVMLDLGFRFQLNNLFELLPSSRQNIMFSATMTEEIDELIQDFFIAPETISIAVSGTPLDNISQAKYGVKNFYTKINLLVHLLKDKESYKKVLIFVSGKRNADRIFEKLDEDFNGELGVIHSNKTQNYRFKAIEKFEEGTSRLLLSTDVMARGLDLNQISHVINFNVPAFPENYMHRIGRTGRAEQEGSSILLFTAKEREFVEAIETLMVHEISEIEIPEEVEISKQLTPDERPDDYVYKNPNRNLKLQEGGASFHEKKAKNQKTNQGGKYRRELAKKYKKPKSRGGKKKK
ncbi:MAG: DEAD/DEAH box helicase [Flavobacteriales bacterium]|nr:DEAD/DEAH box helicase [Flavobacteriales bacterium]